MFNHPEELRLSLTNALAEKGPDYKPRTRHLDDNNQPIYTNRLIFQDSPYLLQHAHNPVDWYPWGEEAFQAAKDQDKPVFLSIGYSTCHWCHVMEEESFDNEEVAKHMNEQFICIKVDRECHPDIDTYYMTAVMMMQGQGGWPMSSFLTPDKKPFFGGTYFQASQFITLMSRVNEVWQKQRNDILEQSNAFAQQLSGAMAARQSMNEIGTNVLDTAAQAIMNHHDPHYGGFGQAPKFPNEPYLYFLLEYAIYSENQTILGAVINTLHIQSCGGIYDQIGGGFHRYATDMNWLIPHFEKMLYNQANLSYVFAQAYQITGEKDFKRISSETLDYVLREMTHEEGGFYSATDADSEGEEGLFFTWDKAEIESLLKEQSELFNDLYQISKSGNFEGRNIPNLAQPLAIYAEKNKINYEALILELDQSKKILWKTREKRIPPLRDDKIITAWNGMLIKSLAYVGKVLEREDYIEAATRAARYLLEKNQTKDNSLSRVSLNGQASIPALQEDYAYLAEALIELHDATEDLAWLNHATEICDQMIDTCWDNEQGGFFMSPLNGDSQLPSSPKEIQDNATASGNSVALRVLAKLAKRTDSPKYKDYAQQLIQAWSDDITQRPYICSYLMCGLLEMLIGEQSNKQYCANGNILINASLDSKNKEVTLKITTKEKWHLNQQEDDKGICVPLIISPINDNVISNIKYPKPIEKELGFETNPVKVYEGTFEINFNLEQLNQSFPGNVIKLILTLQACDDKHCLAPESVNLTIIH